MPDQITCELLDFGCHMDKVSSKITEALTFTWDSIVGAFIAILAAIPAPSWLTNLNYQLPSSVLWFAHVLNIEYGAGVMAAAWVIRFTIRRLPIVG